MNIETLRCFILVAQNLSFARAAETLCISQPAVTKQINSLEQELGVPLFIRSTRHVELTPAGTVFLKDAMEIVFKTKVAINNVQNHTLSSNTIRIAVPAPSVAAYLIPALKKFHLRYPHIQPQIITPGTHHAKDPLRENKVDLLLTYKENLPVIGGSSSFLPLGEDHLCFLLPKEHPLADRSSLSPEDFSDETFITCSPTSTLHFSIPLFQLLTKLLPTERTLFCESTEICQTLASAGVGVSLLPSISITPMDEIVSIPLRNSERLPFGILYHKNNPNPAAAEFLKILKET